MDLRQLQIQVVVNHGTEFKRSNLKKRSTNLESVHRNTLGKVLRQNLKVVNCQRQWNITLELTKYFDLDLEKCRVGSDFQYSDWIFLVE